MKGGRRCSFMHADPGIVRGEKPLKKSPSVLLYGTNPQFFERRDTWFNRRGVEVFCSMTAPELLSIAKSRAISLILSSGVPASLSHEKLRRFIPEDMPVLVLAKSGDAPELLQAYHEGEASAVLVPPYEDRVMCATAEALKVPVRHYLRMLVQLRVGHGRAGGGFGFTNNVSATGLLLETKTKLKVGSEVKVSFMIPGAGAMTAVTGRVVRDAGLSPTGCFRYGVHFLDISADDQTHIRAMVSQDPVQQAPPALPA
ncbi:MAG: hypothetical protein ACI9OJ_002160 [Myxococcota bacterium]|jgi:hypothetical protein